MACQTGGFRSLQKYNPTRQTALQTSVGTDGYKAPEILALVHSEKAGQYSEKCDIWSYGCLVYELLWGQVPFLNVQRLGTFCRRGNCYELDWLRDTYYQAWQFISQLLKASPRQRLTAAQALLAGGPWFDTASRFEQHNYTSPHQDFANTYNSGAFVGRYRPSHDVLYGNPTTRLASTWTDHSDAGYNYHQTSTLSTAPPARNGPQRRAYSAGHLFDEPPSNMTSKELRRQQERQQHLLREQMFQQYQHLQQHEQELRWQLYGHRE